MKARNRKTGEIVDIIAYSQYTNRDSDVDYVSYIDSKGVEHFHVSGLNYYWDFEPIEESKDAINWEQRKYEIAKSIAQAIWASTKEATFEQCADFAIEQANILIKKLKDENKR